MEDKLAGTEGCAFFCLEQSEWVRAELQNRRILSSTDVFMGSHQVCAQAASSRSLSERWVGRKGNGTRRAGSSIQKKGSQRY